VRDPAEPAGDLSLRLGERIRIEWSSSGLIEPIRNDGDVLAGIPRVVVVRLPAPTAATLDLGLSVLESESESDENQVARIAIRRPLPEFPDMKGEQPLGRNALILA
jgi:hypothetical protein